MALLSAVGANATCGSQRPGRGNRRGWLGRRRCGRPGRWAKALTWRTRSIPHQKRTSTHPCERTSARAAPGRV